MIHTTTTARGGRDGTTNVVMVYPGPERMSRSVNSDATSLTAKAAAISKERVVDAFPFEYCWRLDETHANDAAGHVALDRAAAV
eukprot:SAG31_NODE_14346_length_812_cov_1.008415_1_plen_83_part_10